MTVRAPVIALSHGGGPMPLLGDARHRNIADSLRTRVPSILRLNSPSQRPRAIVLVTAHWAEHKPTISSADHHDLYYDYYNFPPEAYNLKYAAPGSSEVAKEIATELKAEGLDPVLDAKRGWDHGVFVPMTLIRPQADIPVVQMSVLSSEDPVDHFRMGRALQKLRDSNVVIIGSGFATCHNTRVMLSGGMKQPDFQARNEEWSRTVTGVTTEENVEERAKGFKEWRKWPHAYEMHPKHGAEHFLPLIVAAGAAGEEKAKWYTDEFQGASFYSYYWD